MGFAPRLAPARPRPGRGQARSEARRGRVTHVSHGKQTPTAVG